MLFESLQPNMNPKPTFLDNLKKNIESEKEAVALKYGITDPTRIFKDNEGVWRSLDGTYQTLEEIKKNKEKEQEIINDLYKKEERDPFHHN
jgi:hypothetical protein